MSDYFFSFLAMMLVVLFFFDFWKVTTDSQSVSANQRARFNRK